MFHFHFIDHINTIYLSIYIYIYTEYIQWNGFQDSYIKYRTMLEHILQRNEFQFRTVVELIPSTVSEKWNKQKNICETMKPCTLVYF